MKNYRSLAIVLLLLTLCTEVLADGINKPKRKHHRKPKAVVVKPIPASASVKPAVKLPSLLSTTFEAALAPTLKPLESLMPVPQVPLAPPVVTSETFVYPFEEEKKRPWLWFLLGAAAIPFLVPHGGDDVPIPTTTTQLTTTTTGADVTGADVPDAVPEPSALVLLSLGVLGVVGRLRARRKQGR